MKLPKRSRRDIELSLDLPFLNPKVKRKSWPSLSEKELLKLIDKCKQDNTRQGEEHERTNP